MRRAILNTLPIVILVTVPGISSSSLQKGRQDLLADLHHQKTPFQEGERLSYEVNWKPLFMVPAFKAGEITFTIRKSEYNKRPTYTISAWTKSEGLLSSVAGLEVRDYFESIIDRKDFRSYRMLRQVRQSKRKRDLEVIFNYNENYTLIREVNLEVDPAEELLNEKIEDIPGPVADIVSVFYVARLRLMKPGQGYFTHLSDGRKVKKIDLRVHETETVPTDLGSFDSVMISTVGGLLRGGGDFRVWYSKDPLHTPVRFEADAKVGKVYGKIIRQETPRKIRSVVRVP